QPRPGLHPPRPRQGTIATESALPPPAAQRLPADDRACGALDSGSARRQPAGRGAVQHPGAGAAVLQRAAERRLSDPARVHGPRRDPDRARQSDGRHRRDRRRPKDPDLTKPDLKPLVRAAVPYSPADQLSTGTIAEGGEVLAIASGWRLAIREFAENRVALFG